MSESSVPDRPPGNLQRFDKCGTVQTAKLKWLILRSGMPAQKSCEQCVELWRKYGKATRAHVELLKQQERFGGLDFQIEIAARERDSARAALKIHLATEHSEAERQTATSGGS